MRQKFGKFVGTLLVPCMMATMFAGCGTKEKKVEDVSTNQVNEQNEDSANTEGTYKIGGIGPITGSAAIYGMAVQNATQLAVDEINATGGVNGHKLEFKFADDENDPEKAVNAYNSLKDWGMQILAGTVTSDACIAVASKTVADNMYQLTPSGTAVDCVANDNAFRVCFSDPNQGTAAASYIGSNKLGEKVAVIYDSSSSYSAGIYENFAAEAKNQGFEIVTEEAFTADNKTDFSVQLQKAKDAGADLLFLPIYYTEATLILKQADTLGYEPTVFGCDGLDGILSVENFDTSLAEGVMLLTPFVADATDDKTVAFVDAYKKAYNETPNQFAADAYDAVYTIKSAIEKSGVTPDQSISELCDGMKNAMTEISVDGVTGTITWTADGEPSKEAKAMVIENGVYKAID